MPPIVPKLAKELFNATTIVGSSPAGKPIIRLKPGSPAWMQDIIASAHDNTPPDSNVYRVVEIAADLISDGGQEWEIRERLAEVEPMQELSELMDWLESNPRNREYANAAVRDYGAESHQDALLIGQQIWIDEITITVLDELMTAGKKRVGVHRPYRRIAGCR